MENKDDINSSTNQSHGQLTSEIGRSLRFEAYDVFYDHDISSEFVGKIVSYFGDKNERGTQLSYLDLAVVRKNSNKAIAFIEIEETANRPKTVIADIFGFLMGEKVAFQGKELEVGKHTTLIVLVFCKVQNQKHNQYTLEKVEKVKSELGTKNSKIGKILVETYSDNAKLSTIVTSLLDQVIKDQ